MDNYNCVRENMAQMCQQFREIQQTLDNTYRNAKILYAELSAENQTNWNGKSCLTACAFMDLTMQYHNLLAGGGEGAVKEAQRALENFFSEDNVFYSDWEEYTEILSI